MHPNNMTVWDKIECIRGCGGHVVRQHVPIKLDGPTGYTDCTDIPHRFAREFLLNVWDTNVHPVDGGPYCPAHDAVSETILSRGVWEPRETTLMMQVCSTANMGDVMIDMGAQLGWYSLIAATFGLSVIAFEADPANAALLTQNFLLNDMLHLLTLHNTRIGRRTLPIELDSHVRFVKIDLEGAELDAVMMLSSYLQDKTIDHMMIEVSPCFDDYYPNLVTSIMRMGYRAFMLPPKRRPPIQLDTPEVALKPYELVHNVKTRVASWHQEDVWFMREDATW